jgi:hypothetical protein
MAMSKLTPCARWAAPIGSDQTCSCGDVSEEEGASTVVFKASSSIRVAIVVDLDPLILLSYSNECIHQQLKGFLA